MNLNGRTLIATGVAPGIGKETERLARFLGTCMIGVDRQSVNMALDALHQADLSKPAAIDALVSSRLERVDALVNSALVPGTTPVDGSMLSHA